MKRLMLITALLALMATPALSAPTINIGDQSLGYWGQGDPGSTYQVWDFTPVSQNPANHIQFFPEQEFNPNDYGRAVFAQTLIGTWDGQSTLTGNLIIVDLKINDYPSDNPCKYIWVDLGLTSGSLVNASVEATAPETDVAVTNLDGPAPNGTGTSFGFLLEPNPYWEDILITMSGSSGSPAVLDWVHVDTICTDIPEPATLFLLTLGGLTVLRKKK